MRQHVNAKRPLILLLQLPVHAIHTGWHQDLPAGCDDVNIGAKVNIEIRSLRLYVTIIMLSKIVMHNNSYFESVQWFHILSWRPVNMQASLNTVLVMNHKMVTRPVIQMLTNTFAEEVKTTLPLTFERFEENDSLHRKHFQASTFGRQAICKG